jgi:hypothetical protein
MLCGVGLWFIISAVVLLTMDQSHVQGTSRPRSCWARGMCVYMQGDSIIGDWIAEEVTGMQLGCWGPENGCYCSQCGQLKEGASCQLVAIVN